MAELRTDAQRVRRFRTLSDQIETCERKLDGLRAERNGIILSLLTEKSERRVAALTGMSRTMVQKIRLRASGRNP